MHNLKFEETDHKYTVDGRTVKSVTQILSSVGVKNEEGYFNSLTGAEYITDDTAAEFGKAFHKYACYMLTGVRCVYDTDMEPWIDGLNKFLEAHSFLLSAPCKYASFVELPLYSEKYDYAGTADWIVELLNKIIVIDWKTSIAKQRHWNWQTAAYAQLVREKLKTRKPIETMTVRIFENGYDPIIRKPSEVKTDFNKFLSILNVLRFAK